MSILPQLIANSLIAGAIYLLVALGFNLIFSVTKFFNLAHGAMAVVAGYSVFYFGKMLGWNVYLVIILAVLIAGCLGFGVDKVVYRPLRRRKASNLVLLVASLGVFTVLQAVIAILFSSQFQTISSLWPDNKVYEFNGAIMTQVQIVMLLAGLIIAALLAFVLKKTMFGKAVKAIGDDEEVAKIIGVDTNKIIGKVFFIGSAMAGLAGILVGVDTGLEPTMGLELLLNGIIAAIIGGLGNLYGGVLGAFLLGFVENFGIWKIPGEWKAAIAFGLLIIFLLFRPQGIIKK